MKTLVVGAGSIGRRHLANLRQLGVEELAACDPDISRLAPMEAELGVQSFSDFNRALAVHKPEVVFICTPPVLHVSQAGQAIHAGCHVFIEKPLSNSLEGVDKLLADARTGSRIVQVGYNLRFHPGLRKLKQLVESGALGRVLWAHVEAGQYLPDWRPWQDYRQSYTARRDLGGGILLDSSHELDYITWLLGYPSEIMCMAGKISALQVDVEDCADLLLRFATGAQAQVHLDFVQRAYTRSCKLVGELGSALWDFTSREVRFFSSETKEWESFSYTFETNDMYVSEVNEFLSCVADGNNPLVDLHQGVAVLKLVLAAKSAAERQAAKLQD